jgi:hypothetical protein
MLLSGVIKPDRFVIDPILVMVMQHWFVLVKYLHEPSYNIVIELFLEVWFGWSMISQMEVYAYMYPALAPVAALGMLVAHWIYLLAAFMGPYYTSHIKGRIDIGR